jgi:hypothetical protein
MKNQRRNFITFAIIPIGLAVMMLVLAVVVSGRRASAAPNTRGDDHVITLDQAIRLVENFKNAPTAPTTKGGYFARSIFDRILPQPGCAGLRYYYAKRDDGTATLVFVGVDGGGNDIIHGVLGDEGWPCPPNCGVPNQLNK